MAKLYFYYSSMNAGKSTALLQSNYNYLERGMKTILFTSKDDVRDGKNKINSRIGISKKSNTFDGKSNIFTEVQKYHLKENISCVLVDEAQFLTKKHVRQLSRIVDDFKIPVLAYGIRTDFKGELFEGSKYLLAWSDTIKELKTICHCGSKATMVLRVDEKGQVETTGKQLEVGGNERYVPLCRKHFFNRKIN